MRRNVVQLEALECRRLMAAWVVDDDDLVAAPTPDPGLTITILAATVTGRGTLVVKGSERDDAITVVRDGNRIKYRTAIGDNAPWHIINASQVKRVLVEAGGGDDRVFIDNELAKRTTVYGGPGNDNIDGNRGSTLIGGGGNDRLFAQPAIASTRVRSGRLTTDFRSGHLALPERPPRDLSVPSAPDTITYTFSPAAPTTPTFGIDTVTVDGTSTFVPISLLSIGPALLSGGEGNDTLVGTAADTVVGGRGRDRAIELVSPSQSGVTIPEAPFRTRASGIEEFLTLQSEQPFILVFIADSGDVNVTIGG